MYNEGTNGEMNMCAMIDGPFSIVSSADLSAAILSYVFTYMLIDLNAPDATAIAGAHYNILSNTGKPLETVGNHCGNHNETLGNCWKPLIS